MENPTGCDIGILKWFIYWMFCGCFYTICIHVYVGIFQNTEKSLHLGHLALLWSSFVHQQGKETKDNKKKMGKKPKHELNDTKMFCRALILPWLKYFPCILLLFTWQKNTVGLMKFDCHNLVHIAKFVLNAWVPETLPWNAYREVWCLTFLSASVLLNLLHNLISPKFFVCMQMCGVRKRCW